VLFPELLELDEPPVLAPTGAVVTSGIDPKPVSPTGGAWQATTSSSARVFRGPTPAP